MPIGMIIVIAYLVFGGVASLMLLANPWALALATGTQPPMLGVPYVEALVLGFAGAAYGLFRRARWGRTLTITALTVQLAVGVIGALPVWRAPAGAPGQRGTILRNAAVGAAAVTLTTIYLFKRTDFFRAPP